MKHLIGYNLTIILATLLSPLRGDELEPIHYPSLPDEKLFTALKSTSPFLRTINISETYSLKAIATYQDIGYARIYNKDTKQTVTIEVGGESRSGLNLIKINEPGNSTDLSGVSARISFAGEVAELKYSPEQLAPTSRGGSGRSEGGKGRGGQRKKGPPSKDREKYQKLSVENRTKLKEYIKATVKKYPNMPGSERGNLIRGALQKLSDGRTIEIPK